VSEKLDLADQLAGLEFAMDRLAAELARGLTVANASGLTEMETALARLRAAATTLRWLARDREGCIRLLTTKFGATPQGSDPV